MWKGFDLAFIFALNDIYAYATMAETKIVRPIQLRADCGRASNDGNVFAESRAQVEARGAWGRG
eukprot:scaffold108711_cov59-Phaeocystis_antarctica.AAC.1